MDFLHETGEALGYPTEREECRRAAMVGEHRQDPVGVSLDPALEVGPVLTVEAIGKCLNLKIILDVNGHGVDQGGLTSAANATPAEWLERWSRHTMWRQAMTAARFV